MGKNCRSLLTPLAVHRSRFDEGFCAGNSRRQQQAAKSRPAKYVERSVPRRRENQR